MKEGWTYMCVHEAVFFYQRGKVPEGRFIDHWSHTNCGTDGQRLKYLYLDRLLESAIYEAQWLLLLPYLIYQRLITEKYKENKLYKWET